MRSHPEKLPCDEIKTTPARLTKMAAMFRMVMCCFSSNAENNASGKGQIMLSGWATWAGNNE
jgi:hypothetical protein